MFSSLGGGVAATYIGEGIYCWHGRALHVPCTTGCTLFSSAALRPASAAMRDAAQVRPVRTALAGRRIIEDPFSNRFRTGSNHFNTGPILKPVSNWFDPVLYRAGRPIYMSTAHVLR